MLEFSETDPVNQDYNSTSLSIPQSNADGRFYVLSMADESKKGNGLLKGLANFFDSCGSFMWNVFVPALLLSVVGLVVAEFLDPGTIADLHDKFWKIAKKL